ncbi:MAG TPA: aminotransferase class V-fold PLP-dependent enzyme [Gemmatimonadaceae bacterium]|nr:aminotransferase class V-fold PLP-dependent enzyme [Gemmatimonadaceae bacterium]
MVRRDFLERVTVATIAGSLPRATYTVVQNSPDSWRAAFPALKQEINGKPLAYLDTAATALRPQAVIDAIANFYAHDNANPGGALHTLARRANAAMESARAAVASFINAPDPLEVVFTRGTTEGLNLVANAWGRSNLKPGDEILIGMAEHSSNMLPWRYVAKATGARVVYFAVDEQGHPRLDDISAKLTARTRIVAFSHVSNVLGMINPVRDIVERVKAPNRIVVIDGAQSVPHFPVDVREIGCDFMAFSSHKMLGPMGVGVLWGRRELLEAMAPYQVGSNMAHDVDLESEHLSDGALKYSAGTPNASGPVGLAAAIAFIRSIGQSAITAHERQINRRMFERLGAIRGVRVLGARDPERRVSVFSFTVERKTPPDAIRAMDAEGIAIRGGDLASLPLLRHFGTSLAARASCYLYTSLDDVDRFGDALERFAAG